MLPRLTDDDAHKFQELWKKETGKDIDLATARKYAGDILGLVELVIRPHKPDQA